MCGIVGILKPGAPEEIKNKIEQLVPYIDHRGPDDWGSFASRGIGLGHSRLSIIDFSHGQQPMNSEKSCIAFNGEVYNYIELRKELAAEGAVFNTESDTEVVQRAIEWWGESAYAKFNGQFAVLFWDKRTKTLTAVCDRYGIRPLYYFHYEGGWYFSSEMKVFDHINGRTRYWAPQNLFEHGLFWNTFSGDTVFKDVYSLEGGHFMKFSENEVSASVPYYILGEHYSGKETGLSEEDLTEALKEKLEESVRLRLRSDVPVGCYLSGGIDSSVTSLLAKRVNKKQFKSFSITFSDKIFDESEYQHMMVKSLDSDHYSVNIDGKTVADNFYNAAKHFERPVFRTAPVPLYLLSEKVRRENIKVVLTGEAADEVLFGYDTNKELKLLSLWKNGLNENEILNTVMQLNPHLDYYKDKEQLGFLKMYYESFVGRSDTPLAGLVMRVNNNQVLSNMFNKDWGLSFELEKISDQLDNLTPEHVKDWDIFRRNQYLEMKTLLPGYLLSAQGDRMAMAHGIEGRFPFLDHNLIEWLLTVPTDMKIKGFSTKNILKETFKNDIPEPIVNRPKRTVYGT